jgi:putative Holliday junction resolvase
MARILAIDYGTKRIGLAVTDPLQIIATPLATVPSTDIWEYLQKYTTTEPVELFVVGEPRYEDGNPSATTALVNTFVRQLQKKFPNIPIKLWDERFTSILAKQTLLQSGLSKKKRADKSLLDSTSATIILQEYMEANIY